MSNMNPTSGREGLAVPTPPAAATVVLLLHDARLI